MEQHHLISADEFCTHHQIELSFIDSLRDYDLLKITTIGSAAFIEADDLREVESLVRLHYDLHINLEGIDAVKNLLQQVQEMQKELKELKARLQLHQEM